MANPQNLVPLIDDLVHVFEDGVRAGGITFDADLCIAFVDALREAGLAVSALVDPAVGCIEVGLSREPQPRTIAERRRLARLAVALDLEGRVIRLPTPAIRTIEMSEGGSVA